MCTRVRDRAYAPSREGHGTPGPQFQLLFCHFQVKMAAQAKDASQEGPKGSPVYLNACLPASLHACMPACLPACLPVCQPTCLCLPVSSYPCKPGPRTVGQSNGGRPAYLSHNLYVYLSTCTCLPSYVPVGRPAGAGPDRNASKVALELKFSASFVTAHYSLLTARCPLLNALFIYFRSLTADWLTG